MHLDAFTELAGGLDHPEGVALGPDGLVYAGGEAGQIYRVGADGSVTELASTGGFLYGVALDADLNVYACDFGNASVARITPTGDVSTYSSGTADRPMRVPNFAAFDDEGNLYVTDSGEWGSDDGLIYRISYDGATTVWTEALNRFPNGCCLSADGGSLYVVESRGRAISRIAFADDGSPDAVEQMADLTGSQPDGIALATDGSLIVGYYRPDRVSVIRTDGSVEVLAEDPDGVVLNQPANIVFVGEGLSEIVVSSLGGWSLMKADVGLTGAALRYPKVVR
jgi:gluconolactonase